MFTIRKIDNGFLVETDWPFIRTQFYCADENAVADKVSVLLKNPPSQALNALAPSAWIQNNPTNAPTVPTEPVVANGSVSASN